MTLLRFGSIAADFGETHCHARLFIQELGGLTMSKKVLVVDDDPDVRLFNVTVVEEMVLHP